VEIVWSGVLRCSRTVGAREVSMTLARSGATAEPRMHGHADAGFGAVADAFRLNLVERNEVGAACAVYVDGRPVVDVWGGHRDAARTSPWERDTMIPVFSATKGMASAAMAVAHGRGLFHVDDLVVDHWPEFGQAGKERITVRQLLTHRAGLAVIDTPVTLEMLADPEALGRVLAAQAPKWEPGRFHGYHGQSLGWYESQLLRRCDPDGRTIGRYFADEVARPLGVDFHIGLPDEVGEERLATFLGGRPAGAILHLHEMPWRLVLALMNPFGLTGKVFRNPKALASASDISRRELLRIELPSVNGTGTARAVAEVYSAVVSGDARLGLDRATIDLLERSTPPPPGGAIDRILKVETAYAFGFMKPFPLLQFGSSSRAFGHTGTGGSFGYADPDHRLGYAYVMNRMDWASPTSPRELALRRALDRCLA
jgi:CubicO group peptidase (beta-lactamase class C family)